MSARLGVTVAAATLGVVAATIAIVGTGLGWWNGTAHTGEPAHPLAIRTSLAPSPAFFGDPVVAEVAVDVDTNAIAMSSVRVDTDFAPYLEAEQPLVRRHGSGRAETVTYRYTLQCVTDACLPPVGGAHSVQFPPVVVTATSGSRRLTVTKSWPATSVSSRLQHSDLSSVTPRFRHPAELPPTDFGVSPTVLADLLTAAAALLAAAAFLIAALELAALAAHRRGRTTTWPTPLARALALTRQAARSPDASDRRKALGLLAETLRSEGALPLADTTGSVAWSQEPPSPARALELADQAERTGAEK